MKIIINIAMFKLISKLIDIDMHELNYAIAKCYPTTRNAHVNKSCISATDIRYVRKFYTTSYQDTSSL